MIIKVNNERTFRINPGTMWCVVWHNPLWFLGVFQSLFLALSGALATAGIHMPPWAFAVVLFLGAAIHNLQTYLKANPPPEPSPHDAISQ